MSGNLTLLVVAGVLVAAGVYLLLDRSLTRVLLGFLLLGNGVNLVLLMSGGPTGRTPISDRFGPDVAGDPLAQAMILTAIVITMGLASFVLTMIYRAWQLHRGDDVLDDTEDRSLGARLDRPTHADDPDDFELDDLDASEGLLDERGEHPVSPAERAAAAEETTA